MKKKNKTKRTERSGEKREWDIAHLPNMVGDCEIKISPNEINS